MNLCGHKLEESNENKSTCLPFDEFSHVKSYKELSLIYKAVSQEKLGRLDYEMLLAIENCNSFSCKCANCDVCGKINKENNNSQEKMQNCSDKVDQPKKNCCSKEENVSFKSTF